MTFSTALVLILSVLFGNPAPNGTHNFLAGNLPACQQEDGINCVWDAQSQGNGHGKSFVAIGTARGVWRMYADGSVQFDEN